MHLLRLTLILLFLTLPRMGAAQELRVLTSFPPEFSTPYVAMWDQAAPQTDIRVLNKNTVAGIDEILRGNTRGFDVFWASSPEAFELLSRHAAFADPAVCGKGGPRAVEPFALSSVGWARRVDSSLFMPADWDDLLRPIYRDKIAMARPTRSGTTHMMLEQILQVRGWNDGWAYILELAGNISTLTARSYGVPDGLKTERFDIGLTIDFLAQSQRGVLDFRYGRPVVMTAARVGILKGGRASSAACDFLHMLLSPKGQRTLVAPEISRIPYNASVRSDVAPELPDGIVEALDRARLDYDAGLSSDRYWAVNTLFDVMVTDMLVERRNLWRRFHALTDTHNGSDLRAIRALLTRVPVTGNEAIKASEQTQNGVATSTLTGVGALGRNLVQDWRDRVMDLTQQTDHALRALEEQADR
ncbi:substrate-binding domain-containing protein [uncultured Aliiroseovarius sp.]|uniref:ABC transporter substrate-binding protein n=1 Tax=uncultured Aliiroseovarius sp. TaxID=1658783 RepID=UPI002593805B|nr:substrate-binding domain-containing protein [uncultured Aliiroseovarius sp.]